MPHSQHSYKDKLLAWLRRVWAFILSLTIFTSPNPGLPVASLEASSEKRGYDLHASQRNRRARTKQVTYLEEDDPEASQLQFLPHPSLRKKSNRRHTPPHHGSKKGREASLERRRQRRLAKVPDFVPPPDIYIEDCSDSFGSPLLSAPTQKEVQRNLPRVIITPSTPIEESRARAHSYNRKSYSVSLVMDADTDLSLSSEEVAHSSSVATEEHSEDSFERPDSDIVRRTEQDEFTARIVCQPEESPDSTPPNKDNGFIFTDSLTEIAFGHHSSAPAVAAMTDTGVAGPSVDWPSVNDALFDPSIPESSSAPGKYPSYATSTPRLDGFTQEFSRNSRPGTQYSEGSFYEENSLLTDGYSGQSRRTPSSLQYPDLFDFDMYVDTRLSTASIQLNLTGHLHIPNSPNTGDDDGNDSPGHINSSSSPPPPYIFFDPAGPTISPSGTPYRPPISFDPAALSNNQNAHLQNNGEHDPLHFDGNFTASSSIVHSQHIREASAVITSVHQLSLTGLASTPLLSEINPDDSATLAPFSLPRSRRTISEPSDQSYYHPSVFPLQHQAQHVEEVQNLNPRMSSPTLPSMFETPTRRLVSRQPRLAREQGYSTDESANHINSLGKDELSNLPPVPEKMGGESNRGSTATSRRGSSMPIRNAMSNFKRLSVDGPRDSDLPQALAKFNPNWNASPYVYRLPSSGTTNPHGPRPLRVVNGPPASDSSGEKSQSDDELLLADYALGLKDKTAKLYGDELPHGRDIVPVDGEGKENREIRTDLRMTDGPPGGASGRTAILLTQVNRQAERRRAGIFSTSTNNNDTANTMSFDLEDDSRGTIIFNNRSNENHNGGNPIFQLGMMLIGETKNNVNVERSRV